MSQDDTAEEPDEDLWEAFDDDETLPCSCSYVSWVALTDVFFASALANSQKRGKLLECVFFF